MSTHEHLTRKEQVELSQLLLRARGEGPPLRDEDRSRMRALVVKENPRVANHPEDSLVSAGLIALGALWFLRGPPPEEWPA
ncbi:MAG: hypothetical protein QOI63_305 [Thermoplasmata archaeon]|jgi:hypothetical protein|nr:hypothetical protein [Thermoplasmata archaeon]